MTGANMGRVLEAFETVWGLAEPGGSIQEGSCRALPSGYEATVYSAMGITGDGCEKGLILKLYPEAGDAMDSKASGEFDAIRAVSEHVRVPKAYGLVPSGQSALGGPYLIMERVGTHGMWEAISRANDIGRKKLVWDFADAMRGIHGLDCAEVGMKAPFDTRDPFACQEHALNLGTRILRERDGSGEWLPVLEWMLGHYREYPCERYTLVHNDLHPANVMVDDSGNLHVIDWTNPGVDDPRSELAWTLATMVCFPWFTDALKEAYPIPDGMDYFMAGGCLKKVYGLVQPLSDPTTRERLLPHAREQMLTTGPQVKACHDMLRRITGISIPSVERFIDECGS